MTNLEPMRQRFRQLYGGEPRVFHAPGRVNLIGEHVDYNEGWVLPIAIDRYCFALACPRDDRRLRIYSEQKQQSVEYSLDDARSPSHHWSDYVRGVAWSLGEAGCALRGADLLIDGDVPVGGGVSSSAALEIASASALLGISGATLDRAAIARACQRAENEFVGMRCGIMDQLAACFGRKGHALCIDCRSLGIEMVPLDEAKVRVVVANTLVKHSLASSQYNVRRAECDDAVARLQKHIPGVRALRDVSWLQIERLAADWPENVRQRARHVTTEIARVHTAVAALRQEDFAAMGRLMAESHASLDADYQVTSEELNTMVSLARELPGLLGARMTGGGFGGCTVNIVCADAAAAFADELTRRYSQATGIQPDVQICFAADGAGEVC